jgi:hypothetical protein
MVKTVPCSGAVRGGFVRRNMVVLSVDFLYRRALSSAPDVAGLGKDSFV